MPDPSDPLKQVFALETRLTEAARQVAQALGAPPSQARSAEIRTLWRVFDETQPIYARSVQALRGSLAKPRKDTPLEAASRRQLAIHGPARAALWPDVAAMVARQTLPSSFPPLITTQSEIVRGPTHGPINYLMELLFQLSNPIASTVADVPETHYRDIPLSGAYFLNLLTAARRLLLAQGQGGPVRFLDMGCGGGSKVLAASAMFDVAHGAELNHDYVAQAKSFLARLGVDPGLVFQADALTFEGYRDYEVVYFYRPMKDPALAARLEQRILGQVRPGTVLIAPLNATLGRDTSAATRVLDRIYLAHTPRRRALELAEQAETLGCETRAGRPAIAADLGFWGPIMEQSRANGFALS